MLTLFLFALSGALADDFVYEPSRLDLDALLLPVHESIAQTSGRLLPGEVPPSNPKPYCGGRPGDWHQNRLPSGQLEQGGWVEDTAYVAPDVWLAANAEVCDYAQVLDGAVIKHRARIFDNATIRGEGVRITCPGSCPPDALVHVFGNAVVSGDVWIHDRVPSTNSPTRIYGDAWIRGTSLGGPGVTLQNGANVFGNARVFDQATVDAAKVFEFGTLFEDALLEHDAHVYGAAVLYGGTRVRAARVEGAADVWSTVIEGNADGWAFVGGFAQMWRSRVRGGVRVFGEARVSDATLEGRAIVAERAHIKYGATLRDDAIAYGDVRVEFALVTDRAQVGGDAHVGSNNWGIYVPDPDECPPPSSPRTLTIVRDDARVDGGFVINNAIVEDSAWVGGGTVRGNARISDRARISGGSVYDHAEVSGTAQVLDAMVFEQARVQGGFLQLDGSPGSLRILGEARISGHARLTGGWVYGSSHVSGSARISGNAAIGGSARVADDAWVGDHGRVSDHAMVLDRARVLGTAVVNGTAIVAGNTILTEGTHSE